MWVLNFRTIHGSRGILFVSKTLNTQAQSCAFSIQILSRPVNVDVYLFYLVDRVGIGLAHRASKVVAFIYVHQSSVFLPNLTL